MIGFGCFVNGQNVIFNKIEKTHANTDKFFYKVNPETTSAEYLGEIEIQGFSSNDPEMFGKVYKKAKEIGANAFAFKHFESIDGNAPQFDPVHYKLSLFYVAPENFSKEDNVIYLISSASKPQTISINDKKIVLAPRTYRRIILEKGSVYTISTRKFLGSSIKVTGQENQPVQFFQLARFSVHENPYGSAGISIKSGDIIKLEQSYAQFLTTIYADSGN